ncbi:unnamed protein product [Caenorhabditis angaria]|uniref:Fungal lipase-type domain-containing protein n=1 Tax=Caenorhabditis angaria TaxID=860376 RepID=A0A9P1I8R7_9PELO|nr:unnamed protein product [Caenorhabditis angaria]
MLVSASYSPTPNPCVLKNNGSLFYANIVPCDYIRDECLSIIAVDSSHIFVAFSGTKSKEQLFIIIFFAALKSMWNPMHRLLREAIKKYPTHELIFTGHSLGGAIASIASTAFVRNHPEIGNRTSLITFGQPRVGNLEYAQKHDELLRGNSWRIIHARDIVAHIPICVESVHRPITCIPFYNHGSYHHGTEIWFPQNMTSDDTYQICRGFPKNEDIQCSNSDRYYDIFDHLFYFGHHVSDYGVNNCTDPVDF